MACSSPFCPKQSIVEIYSKRKKCTYERIDAALTGTKNQNNIESICDRKNGYKDSFIAGLLFDLSEKSTSTFHTHFQRNKQLDLATRLCDRTFPSGVESRNSSLDQLKREIKFCERPFQEELHSGKR